MLRRGFSSFYVCKRYLNHVERILIKRHVDYHYFTMQSFDQVQESINVQFSARQKTLNRGSAFSWCLIYSVINIMFISTTVFNIQFVQLSAVLIINSCLHENNLFSKMGNNLKFTSSNLFCNNRCLPFHTVSRYLYLSRVMICVVYRLNTQCSTNVLKTEVVKCGTVV